MLSVWVQKEPNDLFMTQYFNWSKFKVTHLEFKVCILWPRGTETSMTNTTATHRIQISAYVMLTITHKNTLSFLFPNLEVLSIKGQRAADQCVEDHSQAPYVHLRPVVLLALEELRGCVWRGATESVQLVPQSKLIAEAKVCYLDVHVCVQQQVLCLQTDSVWRKRGKNKIREPRRRRM